MRRIAILSCVFLLMAAGVGLAQTTKGAVRVEVKAGDGSLLPGASVVVQSPETLGQRTAVSDSTGVAIVSGLDPSSEYTVTVSLDGFQTQRFENVRVKAGGTASLAASLPLAAVEEEIVVVAEAPTVDFSSAISGQDITLQLTESLPTGRSYQNYLQLVPGVAPTDPSIADENPAVRSGLNYADIGGNMGRSRDNFYYIEGIDVTDLESGYNGADLNTEIIQEQSVLTGGIPAEYAGAPGLVSSVVTKSGGNEYHGSLNYYFQNESLVADNKHADQADFSTYDTAATLGGPIMQDKLWFFGSYRLVHLSQDVSDLGTGEFLRSVDKDADQGFLKVSYNPTASIKLVGTYLTDPTDQSGSLERDIINNRDRAYETGGDRYIINYSQVFGPAYLSLSYGEHNGEESEFAAVQDVYNQVYFRTGDDFTQADEQLGGRGLNSKDERNNKFYNAKLEWYIGTGWGDHTLAFGAERMEHDNVLLESYPGGAQYSSIAARYAGVTALELAQGDQWTGGQWTYSNTSDYTGTINAIDASPNSASFYSLFDVNGDGTISPEELSAAIFNSTSGNPNGQLNYYRIVEEGTGEQVFSTKGTTFYVQDTFQKGRVSINAGLRAEQWKHYATSGEEIYNFDWDLAPRVGVIYDVTGEGRHKLSAYYGRYYDPIRLNMTSFAGTLTGRIRNEQIFLNGEWLTYRVRGGTQQPDALFAPNTKTPYTDDIQLGYEMALGRDMSFEALYINRTTKDILEDYDLCLYAECVDGTNYYPGDITAPGTLWLGLDYFGYDANPGSNFVISTLAGGKREWEGVELVFRKRYSNHWQALASYTHADAHGNTNSDSNADFQGDWIVLDPRAINQWGRQPGSIEHLFKIAGSYHFDNGFVVGGSYRWNSGTIASRTFLLYRRNLPIMDDAYEWNGATDTWLADNAVGSLTNDSWGSLDLRGQYSHQFGWLNTEFFLDIYNVFDDQAAVRNQDLVAGTGAAAFGEAIQWVPPRRMYLGVRLSF